MKQDSLVDPAMFKPPSRMPVVVGTVIGLVLGGVVGGVVGSKLGGTPAKGVKKTLAADSAVAASGSASAGGSAAPADSGAPGPAPLGTSLAARAAAGDVEAKKQIEARPVSERTMDEVLALTRARVEAERKELAELARKITLVPKVVKEDKVVAARLKDLTHDREIAPDVLKMYAGLPGNTGPDLLYNVLAAGKKDDTTTQLAEDLLYSKDVRPKASLELSALLDLRKAEKCEDVQKALGAVKRDADRRAIVPLMRYENKRGCGDKGNEDCWKCLREGDDLKDAQKAVQKRAPP